MIKRDDVFKIGRFAKPHGVKGELALVSDTSLLEDDEDPYIVCDIDGILVPFFIEGFRYKGNSVILLQLECVNNEDAAREFINLEVYYPKAKADEPEIEDHITWDKFIGYIVSDTKHELLGRIIDVDESTINVILNIDYNGNTLLFPAAEELISSVDHDNRQLTVFVPEGLLDL